MCPFYKRIPSLFFPRRSFWSGALPEWRVPSRFLEGRLVVLLALGAVSPWVSCPVACPPSSLPLLPLPPVRSSPSPPYVYSGVISAALHSRKLNAINFTCCFVLHRGSKPCPHFRRSASKLMRCHVYSPSHRASNCLDNCCTIVSREKKQKLSCLQRLWNWALRL